MRKESFCVKMSSGILSGISKWKPNSTTIQLHIKVSVLLLSLLTIAYDAIYLNISYIMLPLHLIATCIAYKYELPRKLKIAILISSYSNILKYATIILLSQTASCVIVYTFLTLCRHCLWKLSGKGIILFFVPLTCIDSSNWDYNEGFIVISLVILLESILVTDDKANIQNCIESYLTNEAEKLKEIVERISEGIVVYGNHTAIYTNKTIKRILGAESNNDVLTKMGSITKEGCEGSLIDEINNFTVSPDKSHFLPEHYKSPDPNQRNLRLINYQFTNALKSIKLEISGFEAKISNQKLLFIVLRDRTTKSELEEAKISENYRMMILSSVSHELLTPLNGILGLLPGLKGSSINDKSKQLLELIHSNANVLLYIIHDIHDFVDMESNKFFLNKKEDSLIDALEDAVNIMSPLAQERNLQIKHTLDSQQCKIIIDSRRIKQIVLNLLTNAIKYSKDNSVIQVTGKFINQSNETMFSVSVQDYGAGMDQSKIKSLFQINKKFKIAKTAGIGLTVSYKIVQKMSGTFNVESNPSEGSTFTFVIPLVKDQIIHLYSTPLIKPRVLSHLKTNKILVTNKSLKVHKEKVRKELVGLCSEKIIETTFKETDEKSEEEDCDYEDEDIPTILLHSSSIKPPLNPVSKSNYEMIEHCETMACSSHVHEERKYYPILHDHKGDTDSLPVSEEFTPRLEQNDETEKEKKVMESYNHPCKCPIVMVVDDTSYNRLAFSIMAETLGLLHCEASDGDEAIKMIREVNQRECCVGIRLIFMDLEMPGKNGFETSAIINNLIKENEIKPCTIVALTSFNSGDYKKGCIISGMKDYCK